ncbi:MAG: DUF4129 domain-containing protein [Chloroflexota bacterium]
MPAWALPLVLAAAEASWLYAWSLLLGVYARGGERPLLGAVAIFLLLVLSRGAAGHLLGRWRREAAIRLAVVALGLGLVALAVRLDYYVALAPLDLSWLGSFWGDHSTALPRPTAPALAAGAGLGLWWRGTSLAARPLGSDDAQRGFRVGLLALVGAALLVQAQGIAQLVTPLGQAALAFCATALASLSLARLGAVAASGPGRDAEGAGLRRQWLALLTLVVGGLVLLVGLLAAAISPGLLAAFLAPLLALVEGALALLVFFIGLLLVPLLLGLEWLLRLVGQPQATVFVAPAGDALLEQLQREGARGVLPSVVLDLARVALVLAAVALAITLLARAVSRPRADASPEGAEEERESLWSWQELWAALMARWVRLLARWRSRQAAGVAAESDTATPAAETSPAALDVRAAYRRLLALAAGLGLKRPLAATPREHLPRLAGRLAPPEDVAALTAAYERARYGVAPPSPAEAESAQQHWRRLADHAAEEAKKGKP